MGGGQKCPQTSTNVGISPQNFLTFSFNPFDRLVQNFKFVPCASPKLLNLNQDHPSKEGFFWSKPWGYDNFSYANASVTKLWSHDHIHNIIWAIWQIFVGDVIDRIYYIITVILKYLYFKKGWLAIFADMIKILTRFIITIYKDLRKIKINWNHVYNLYLYFLI